MKIAFDIDDTILVPSVVLGFGNDTPNYETIAVFKWFQAQGHEMFLWSGSGMDWAQRWGEKFGLQGGEHSNTAKLTLIQVREIRSAYGIGATMKKLGKYYGVNEQTISKIINYKTWKYA